MIFGQGYAPYAICTSLLKRLNPTNLSPLFMIKCKYIKKCFFNIFITFYSCLLKAYRFSRFLSVANTLLGRNLIAFEDKSLQNKNVVVSAATKIRYVIAT